MGVAVGGGIEHKGAFASFDSLAVRSLLAGAAPELRWHDGRTVAIVLNERSGFRADERLRRLVGAADGEGVGVSGGVRTPAAPGGADGVRKIDAGD